MVYGCCPNGQSLSPSACGLLRARRCRASLTARPGSGLRDQDNRSQRSRVHPCVLAASCIIWLFRHGVFAGRGFSAKLPRGHRVRCQGSPRSRVADLR